MARQSLNLDAFDSHDASQALEVDVNLSTGADHIQIQLIQTGFTNDASTIELQESSVSDPTTFEVMNDGTNEAKLTMLAADRSNIIKYILPVISGIVKVKYTPNGNTGTIDKIEGYSLDI